MKYSIMQTSKRMLISIGIALALMFAVAPPAFAVTESASMYYIGNRSYDGGNCLWNFQGQSSSAYSNLYHAYNTHTSKVYSDTSYRSHSQTQSPGYWSYASISGISFPSYTTFWFDASW